MRAYHRSAALLVLTVMTLLPSCQGRPEPRSVVVYASIDQVYAEPILKSFEEKTGIKVLAVYDVEAAKTTSLANRLRAEKARPQADVFWNGEFAQTIGLKGDGVLAPYASPENKDLPAFCLDPENFWTAFGGRARVLLVNTTLVAPEQYPRSLHDLLTTTFQGHEIGLAYPLFGTTLTHAAALYAAWGPERARQFFEQLKQKGVRLVDGNSAVRDLVAGGQLKVGLTDTDDALGAIRRGAPVQLIFPDQSPGGLGTLIIPNTVALIDRSPHPAAGKAFIDFLLSRATEAELLTAGWFDLPSRPVLSPGPSNRKEPVRGMSVDFNQICQQLPRVQRELRELFLR